MDGDAQFYRDGDFVGQGRLPLVAMGAETDLAFGPLDHLQLHWQDLSRNQGDRGLFSSSTEQTRIIVFGAENTSDRPETLRLIYETPFSEQDDLGIDVDLSRRPDARDIDGLRGVYAWDITLAPSEQAEIEMNVELNWPEDQTLIWTP